MYLLISYLIPIFLGLTMNKDMAKGLVLLIVMVFTFDTFGVKGSFPGWPIVILICGIFFLLTNKFNKTRTPFVFPFFLMFFSYMASWLLGPYNKPASCIIPLAYLSLSVLIWNYYKPTTKNNTFLVYIVVIYTIINILYGAYEAFSFTKPFRAWLEANGVFNDHGDFHERYGIMKAHGFTKSFTFFAMSTLMSFVIVLNMTILNPIVKIGRFFSILFCLLCLGGIFISCDRTSIAATIIAIIPIMSLAPRKPWYSILAIMAIALTYHIFTAFFDQMIYSFTHMDDVTGSSFEMRLEQFDAAYKFYNKSPIYGNGLESHDAMKLFDSRIRGSESIIFRLFYARGIIGVLSSAFLYIYTIYYFIKRKCYTIVTIFISFLFYNISTIPVDELYIYPFLFILYKNRIRSLKYV